MNLNPVALSAMAFLVMVGCASSPSLSGPAPDPVAPRARPAVLSETFQPLFGNETIPAGWLVRSWHDVSQPAHPRSRWIVRDGVLQSGTARGTWLISQQEYGDFVLEFEFRLSERGHGGFGFRFPPSGDPAVTGFELQMIDPRYYGTNYNPRPIELTGALVYAVAPRESVFRPLEWNHYSITCRGPQIEVVLNGTPVINLNLDEHAEPPERGQPLGQRPRRGRIGFQELSRSGGHVEIRNARIKAIR